MKIDAHQHYWKTSRTDYGWLKLSLGRIYADYMPEHLKPHLRQFDIRKTVIVQAAPTMEETEFMLQIADHEETVAGVVGWLDLEADDFAGHWKRFRRHPKFVGVRPMIQDLPSDWIIREKVVYHLKLLAEEGFPVDLQANPRHLPYIIKLLETVPDLRAVIDHLAKPPIPEGRLEPWAEQMKRIADFPNIMCKLSGMVPEKLDAPWSKDTIKPFAQTVIQAFGKQRVMFGSDWPVCLFSANYTQVIDLLEFCLGNGWSPEEREALYGGNAMQFYGLRV